MYIDCQCAELGVFLLLKRYCRRRRLRFWFLCVASHARSSDGFGNHFAASCTFKSKLYHTRVQWCYYGSSTYSGTQPILEEEYSVIRCVNKSGADGRSRHKNNKKSGIRSIPADNRKSFKLSLGD